MRHHLHWPEECQVTATARPRTGLGLALLDESGSRLALLLDAERLRQPQLGLVRREDFRVRDAGNRTAGAVVRAPRSWSRPLTNHASRIPQPRPKLKIESSKLKAEQNHDVEAVCLACDSTSGVTVPGSRSSRDGKSGHMRPAAPTVYLDGLAAGWCARLESCRELTGPPGTPGRSHQKSVGRGNTGEGPAESGSWGECVPYLVDLHADKRATHTAAGKYPAFGDEICHAVHEYALGQRPLFGMIGRLR
jgi:hypothetical protein